MNFVFDYHTLSRPVPHVEAVAQALPYIAGETLLLYALIRPHSFHHSWWRVVAAAIVFGFILGYLAQGSMHAPGWYFANLWWLMLVSVGLLTPLLYALARWLIRHKLRHHDA